jgi:predicted GNAT family acetyltransferase
MTDVTDNKSAQRYEYTVNGDTAFANYRLDDDTLVILYVESPPALRGTGAAGVLMQGIVDDAKAQNLKITPICGYAASWLRKHPSP